MFNILIDIHCHANLYLALEQVIQEAKGVGVEKIIAVGMSAASNERILEITEMHEELYPALGIHPEEVKMNKDIEYQIDSVINTIRKNNKKICAIGEIGLDHHFIKEKELYPLQLNIFEKMLALAQELELPVNLHTKGAEEIIFDMLPSFNLPHVNIHWYSGPEKFLRLGIERGYFFSITPAINYSPAVKKTVLEVDSEHLLLESDGPVKYSGRNGTPTMIREVLYTISRFKNIPIDNLENLICGNTKTVFPRIF